MKKYLSAAAAAVTLVLAGCVSYSYTGEKAPAGNAEVRVFTDSAKIGFPYQVLGKAVVSGSYQQVSRDRMIAKLKSEAQKCGADAVLIVEQQVLPEDMIRTGRQTGFFTAFDYDDTNRSWGELHRDVDMTYGSIGKDPKKNAGPGIADYKRIIRAEFLRRTADAKLPADEAAPGAENSGKAPAKAGEDVSGKADAPAPEKAPAKAGEDVSGKADVPALEKAPAKTGEDVSGKGDAPAAK